MASLKVALLSVLQTVQRTVLCMGRKQEAVENVPCGNTVGPTISCTSADAQVVPWLICWRLLAYVCVPPLACSGQQ